MLPHISSADLNHPDSPGEYGFHDGVVSVLQRHVDAWQSQPDTSFRTILLTRVGDRTTRLALGEAHVAE